MNAKATSPSRSRRLAAGRPVGPGERRGVLLLVVLSMLTLFLMLGAAYLVTATRAHESARAFARLTFTGDEARVPHARMLDTVLLRVVRSGSTPTASGLSAPAINFESLLGDKYGAGTVTGSTQGFAVVGGGPAVLTGTVTVDALLRPTDLVGRLITFSAPGRPVTTHRILRATGTANPSMNAAANGFSLTIDVPRGAAPFVLPLASGSVCINGREFAGLPTTSSITPPANEPWDGFDLHNPFLAQVAPGGLISTSTVARIAYTGTMVSGTLIPFTSGSLTVAVNAGTGLFDYDGDLIPDIADNDNDGTPDGLFLDFGLPDAIDAFGNSIQLRASVLIVDLDGRFNVNAHDGLARTVYGGTANWTWTAAVSGTVLFSGSTPTIPAVPIGYSAPLGSGYGPAEVNGAFMFANASPNAPLTGTAVTGTFSASAENPTLFTGPGGSSSQLNGSRSGAFGSRYSNAQPTPRLSAIEGKYGERGANGWTLIYGSTSTPTPFASATPSKFPRPGQPAFDDVASRMSDRRISGTAVGTNDSLSYGVPSIWWTGTTGYNWAASPTISSTTQPLPRGIYNSPPDLHGRMRTTTATAGIVPQLRFVKVEWANANPMVANIGTAVQEGLDDPYELRLDTRRGFGGLLFDPSAGGSGTNAASNFRDNPFTPAEIEPVLRPYDIDTNRLPPRLAAMLGSASEEARLKVTTDSWDTTAITGTAALLIYGTAGGGSGWLQTLTGAAYGTNAVSGVLSGELIRGERFDLNRPLAASGTSADTIAYPGTLAAFTSGTYHQQRQAYFKDLYTLLYSLTDEDTNGNGNLDPGEDRNSNSILDPTPAAKTAFAQWAANVVEFRDADSRIIPFEYDINPKNGWDPDGFVISDDSTTPNPADRKVVWGAERPEIVIQEAFAWRNNNAAPGASGTAGMVITLHRPWNARAFTGTTGAVFIDAEPCDVAFDTFGTNVTGTNPVPLASGTGAALNLVNLGKKSGTTAYSSSSTSGSAFFNDTTNQSYPIWRLRIVGDSTKYVRFDVDNTATPALTDVVVSGVTAGAGLTKQRLSADSAITILSGTLVAVGNPLTTAGTATIFTGTNTTRLATQLLPGSAAAVTIYLERLSDPSQTLTVTGTVPGTTVTGSAVWFSDPLATPDVATIPLRYIPIDVATVSVVDTSPASVTPNATRRDTSSLTSAFWRPVSSSTTTIITLAPNVSGTVPTTITTGNTAWFPWLNRPFVSAAELLLVPQGTALEILQNYQKLTPGTAGTVGLGRSIPISLATLFDAVHVPSRFAGIHGTTTNATAWASMGVSGTTMPVNQVSSFREPGRVNLNTVTAVDTWNAVVAGPLAAPIATANAAGFGLGATPTPANSLFQLLTLSSVGSTIVSDTTPTTTVASGTVPMSTLNPIHEIYTATRLANTVTPRSNVFAVWITLRESVPNDPDSVRYRRAFYIVDRSIPVAYEPGVDHNVWDCVRVRRIIE